MVCPYFLLFSWLGLTQSQMSTFGRHDLECAVRADRSCLALYPVNNKSVPVGTVNSMAISAIFRARRVHFCS
jgi:hypothetical protein